MCSATQRPVAGEVGNGQGEEDGSQRLGREVAQALQSKGTRLVLHFDLNKTLIMVDPAGRKTQSQVLQNCLASSYFCSTAVQSRRLSYPQQQVDVEPQSSSPKHE